MAENRIYAYCRVSKNDGTMTIENQEHAISEWAKTNGVVISTYYKDECMGDTPVEKRPQLPVMLENLREGDTVVVAEVFRLHRSQSGLAKLYREIIEEKKANFVTLNDKEAILNTDQHEKLDLMQLGVKNIILAVLSLCSELEKRNISTRTKRALKERAAKGQKLGRPTIEAPANFKELFEAAARGERTHAENIRELGLKRATYYNIANSLGLKSEKWKIGEKKSGEAKYNALMDKFKKGEKGNGRNVSMQILD